MSKAADYDKLYMYAAAIAAGSTTATANIRNPGEISLANLQAMATAATGAGMETIRETNTYRAIPAPNYRIDANGYVYFQTALAGTIVSSDGVLARRGS